MPHLHKCIGVFNDVMNHFEHEVESKIIKRTPDEIKLCKEHEEIDDKIKHRQENLTNWTKSQEGSHRKYLDQKRKNIDKMIDHGKEVDTYLSSQEISELQTLEAKRVQLAKARDTVKRRKRTISDRLAKYKSDRKLDTKSVHNQLEDHAKIHKLSRGKLFAVAAIKDRTQEW